MNKNDLINDVVVSMQEYLDREQLSHLKVVFTVKLHDFELVTAQTLPSTTVYDNEYIYKRFTIDMTAKGLENSTIKQYLRMAKNFLVTIGKNYREVAGQDITDYLAIRQYKDHISNSYKGTILKYLSSFYRWCYKKRHVEEDIMRDIDYVKTVQKKKVRLSDMEVEDIREVASTLREKALLELMLSTGMRVSEIESLNISDIDFSTGRITIWGEKSNEHRIGFLNTKSKKAISQYLESRNDTCESMFVSERKPITRMRKESINAIAKKLGERAGVNVATTVHIYRKTFASIQYNKTSDILYVSKLLGHASTDVTVKYYLCEDLGGMQRKHEMAA
ncbi:MAG: tyrosine-type recombinase/integrase [Flavobacterium sp.]